MKKNHLTLSAADKSFIKDLLSKGRLPARVYKRATALLMLNDNKSFKEVAKQLNVVHQTVSTWCKSYHSSGLSFLTDAPRPGRPKEIDGLQRAQISSLACTDPPKGYAKWSLRLLAEKVVELGYIESISHNHVGEILKKMN